MPGIAEAGMSDTTSGAETPGKLDYSWIDTPPVVHVPNDQVPSRVAAFRASLKEWGSVGGGTALAERLDSHAGGADFIAGLLENAVDHTRLVFEYRLAGAPAGLLMLEVSGGAMEIKNLATHPGAENAGGILIEFALNCVQRINSSRPSYPPGVLVLESYNAASTAAYQALGFRTEGREMVLEAAKSALWELVGEQWKLKKFKAMKYLGRP